MNSPFKVILQRNSKLWEATTPGEGWDDLHRRDLGSLEFNTDAHTRSLASARGIAFRGSGVMAVPC